MWAAISSTVMDSTRSGDPWQDQRPASTPKKRSPENPLRTLIVPPSSYSYRGRELYHSGNARDSPGKLGLVPEFLTRAGLWPNMCSCGRERRRKERTMPRLDRSAAALIAAALVLSLTPASLVS